MNRATYSFAPFQFDQEQRLLLRDGKPVPLAPKAVHILSILLESHGKLVERAEIANRVWPDSFVEEGNLTVHIFALRKALAEGLGGAPAIETIPRRGYRFVAPVEEAPERRPSRSWRPAAVAALVAVFAAGAWLLAGPSPAPKVSRVVQLTHFGLAESLGSDGSRLFAGQKEGGRFSVVQIARDGGDPAPLPLPFPDARLLDVSPNRKELLVAAPPAPGGAPQVWIVPSGGGAPRRLRDIESTSARWSPDGSRIAYATATSLRIASTVDAGDREVAAFGGTVDAWSPDGKLVRFTRTNPATGAQSIWEVHADGSGLGPLLPDRRIAGAGWGQGQCCGRFTPDGRYFLFRESVASTASIWALPARRLLARPEPVRLYAAAFEIRDFAISPDGKRVLLVGVNESRNLVRFDRGLHQWLPLDVYRTASVARWSPDGQWLSYITFPDAILWRERAGGADRLQLTYPPAKAYGGAWSPDLRQIAFHIQTPGNPGKIAVIPAGGGKPRVLLAGEHTGEDVPNWSPDGKQLLVARYWLAPDGSTTASAICRIDLDTESVTSVPGTEHLGPPAWSPDGRYIAAQSQDFRSLMLYDFRSGQWTAAAHGAFIHAPQWSKDSRSVYYQDTAAGEDQPIYRLDLGNGAPARVAGRKEFLQAGADRFSFSGLTPAGDPTAALIHTNADIYALALDR